MAPDLEDLTLPLRMRSKRKFRISMLQNTPITGTGLVAINQETQILRIEK
jgi:hypothetical protein